jgi:anaerobic selenocysteine-containing dehydrogenase
MYVLSWGEGLNRALGMQSHPSSRGRLCYRGWQVGDLISSPLHLTAAQVRRNGTLAPCAYEEALEAAAKLLAAARDASHPVWVVGAAHLTNEEAFATAHFARAVLHTPHCDSLARAVDEAVIWHLQYVLCTPYRAPALATLQECDVILVLNSNLSDEHPQAYAWLLRAQREGGQVILLDDVDLGLGRIADLYVRVAPAGLASALELLMQVMDNFDVRSGKGGLSAAEAGLDPAALEQAGRLLRQARQPAVVVSTASLPTPAAAAKIAELVLWTGEQQSQAARLYLLRSEANSLGVALMGLGQGGGLDFHNLLASDRALAGLLVVDDDLARWIGPAGLEQVRPRLGGLVVLSAFDSPTVRAADVVLPVATLGEREGSVVSGDGQVWWLEALAEPPGDARPTTQVLADLAERLGGPGLSPTPEALWQQIRQQVMEWAPLDLAALRGGQPGQVHPGVLSQPTGAAEPAGRPPAPLGQAPGRDWILLTRRDEHSWASDPRVPAAPLLERDLRRTRQPYVYLHPDDIAKLGTRPGRQVQLTTEYGSGPAQVRPLTGVPAGVALLPQQFVDLRRQLMGPGEPLAPAGRYWPPVWAALQPLP